MGLQDTVNYIIFDNPIATSVTSGVTGMGKMILGQNKSFPTPSAPEIKIITKTFPLNELAKQQGPYIRIAGILGASAVMLGAYGAHKKYPKDQEQQLKDIAEVANRFHFINALAICAVPMSSYPKISGSLFILGTVLFSGPCYYHAFTGENKFGKVAPFGGTCLILAWLSLIA